MKNDFCAEIFNYLKSYYSKYDQTNTSFCRQLDCLSKKLYIDCTKYNYKTSLEIIEHHFKPRNQGLIDSINYVINMMNQNLDFFYLYNELNLLLNQRNSTENYK
jgi:hypothetical protein